jgi:hypothetical protein
MKQVLIFTLLLCSCADVSQSPKLDAPKPDAVKSQKMEFQLIIPKTAWEPIFFKSIDRRARIAHLPSLRTALPNDDLELRVWHGFGLTELEGFVLRRRSGNWTAVHLDGVSESSKRNSQRHLPTPKSGWDQCWQKLVAMGILTLPDATEIQCSILIPDGMSYVVEINHEFTYRTYMYGNPTYAKCIHAKRMIDIGNFIAEEFGVPEICTRE